MAGTGFSNYLEAKILDEIFGATDFAAPATVYIALFTVMPADDGTGGTELAGGAYARVAVTNNATNWPAATAGDPTTKKNGTAINFPTATADWGTVIGFGIYDASSAGNLLAYGPLETGTQYPATADASTDVFRAPASAFSDGDKVKLTAVEGSALPTGVSADTVYFVIASSADTFKLSLTSGGAAINITADGAALVEKEASKVISNGDTASFAVNALVVSLG